MSNNKVDWSKYEPFFYHFDMNDYNERTPVPDMIRKIFGDSIIRFSSHSVGDCWIICTNKYFDTLPSYLSRCVGDQEAGWKKWYKENY